MEEQKSVVRDKNYALKCQWFEAETGNDEEIKPKSKHGAANVFVKLYRLRKTRLYVDAD